MTFLTSGGMCVKKKIMVLSVTVILFILLSGLSSSGSAEHEKNKISNLIINRCTILNDYYTGKKDYDTTYSKLAEIESQRLFSDDIELMQQYNATEFDKVIIKNVSVDKLMERAIGIPSGEITVIYKDGVKIYSISYFFSCEIKNNTIKLTNLEKI